MGIDRNIRSLVGINGASSSRVLNLLAIGIAQRENAAHSTAPFFLSPVLNNAMVLKHRLRSDEMDAFPAPRVQATKIIIPFERQDLKVGGQSLFVGQRNYEALLHEIGNYRDSAGMKRDMDLLRLIDSVPSLDPFLLRELLRSNAIEPDTCYFDISPADQQRMHDYTATEIGRLSAMAGGGEGKMRDTSTSRLVSAVLSSEVSEKLEPLRTTLGLNADEFREGIFGWRGFIYYKWNLKEMWPRLLNVIKELKAAEPIGRANTQQSQYIGTAKDTIIHAIQNNSNAVRKIVAIYDGAYNNLIEHRNPQSFREFLLGAPSLFLDLGEKMGAMSHVVSFWNYRFPPGTLKTTDAEELTAILQDFSQSLGQERLQPA